MSFGISIGDFIAVGILIKNIACTLQTSASDHQELLLELDGLQRALDKIEHLQSDHEEQTEVNAVRVAALTCKYRLVDFAGKLKKYESLGHVAKASSAEKAKAWRLKLQWGFNMEAEVRNLRAYLIAHVGYLNMRLTTLSLTSSWHVSQEITRQHNTLEKHIADSQATALKVASELAAQRSLIQENTSWAQRLISLFSGCLLPQVAVLVDLVGKIWAMDTQIFDMLVRQQDSTPAPDLHHTWFQQPVKFEDALGRILPVPSEYNIGINAIILDQFRIGPGHDKVCSGEYELFNSIDARKPLSDSELGILVPGMSITMAFVIGLYEQQPVKKCPRPGCQTREFARLSTGGQRCAACSVWFDISRTKLPRPFRFLVTDDVFQQIRTERKWFKNVRIFPSQLPSLPFRVDESADFRKESKNGEPVLPVQTAAMNEIPQHLVTHPSPYRAIAPLPSFPRVEISQELAVRAIKAIADISGVTVQELREICSGKPDFIDALGLDSLLSIAIIVSLTELGVRVPRSATGSYLAQDVFELFLESFILHYVDVFER